MRENLYNILANFVNIVDDCHARGVEPDCNNEINLIEKVLATVLEEQKKAIVEEYGDYRLVVKKRFGYEIGRTLRFFLAPHTQHKKGDDENL